MSRLDDWESEAKRNIKIAEDSWDELYSERIVALIELVRKKDAGIQGLLDLMDAGFLVRDTSNDHKPNWSLQALSVTLEIKKAYEALALTEELK